MAGAAPLSSMIPQPGPVGYSGESASEMSRSGRGGTVPNWGPGPSPEKDDDSSDEVDGEAETGGNPSML